MMERIFVGSLVVGLLILCMSGAQAVENPPTAAFSIDPEDPLTLDEILFFDASSDNGSIVEWLWDFGDTTVQYGQSVSHVYLDDGIYNVSLTVTDDDGLNDTVFMEIEVRNRNPSAEFFFSPTSPTDLENVSFSATLEDLDGSIASVLWDFGDGSTSEDQSPVHRFLDDGLYNVSLLVVDDDGGNTTVSRSVFVYNVVPLVDWSFTPETPTDMDVVEFIGFSEDLDGEVVNWTWDFGEGNVSYELNSSHKFSDDGEYLVSLKVVDDDGDANWKNVTITVLNVPPQASLFVSSEEGVVFRPGMNLTLSQQSKDVDGSIVNWMWDVESKGVFYGKSSIDLVFDSPGSYDVSLRVMDDDGAVDIDSVRVSIVSENWDGEEGFFSLMDILMVVGLAAVVIGIVVMVLIMRRMDK